MWESLSGVLMNHPELISGISMPNWMVPDQYQINNWNRSSLLKMVYSEHNPKQSFACGKKGVWISMDGGETFNSFMEGYTDSPYYFKTNDIFLYETDNQRTLFAAANGGLFVRELDKDIWKRIELSDKVSLYTLP
jgi:hypothetical protein